MLSGEAVSGLSHALLCYFLYQLPACREADVLLLNRCVHPDFFYSPSDHICVKQVYTGFEDLLHPFRADHVQEVHKITRIKRELVLKVNFPTKPLPLGILHVPLNHCLIFQITHLL